jgi:hypothetical protein
MPDHSEYETGARHPVELKKRQDGTSQQQKGKLPSRRPEKSDVEKSDKTTEVPPSRSQSVSTKE